MINLVKNISDNKTVLKVEGALNAESSQVLHEAIEVVDVSNILVLDFQNLEYICSSGLRELLIAKKRFKDNFSVINVNEGVEEIIKMTGFDNFLNYTKQQIENYEGSYYNRGFKSLIESKALEYPNLEILKNETESLTFDDINRAATIMADDLANLGVKENSHVGLISINSISWIIAFFAIQKLGAMALLCNFSYTKEELKTVVDLSDMDFICVGKTKNFRNLDVDFEGLNLKGVYDIDKSYASIRDRFDKYDSLKNKFNKQYDCDYPSVMIFTSGSTGVPKGVILSARNVIHTNLVTQFIEPNDRMLFFLPLFHIFGLAVCFIPCVCTNSVMVVPTSLAPADIVEIINKEKITFFNCVPTMMIAMVGSPNFAPEKVSSLRICTLSGAATPTAQFEYFQKIMPNCNFLSAYGMSENFVLSVTKFGDTAYHITNTVGLPQKNVEIKINNPDENGVGEILVRSDSLMTAYYKLPLDQQGVDEDGFMHTGDLGCFEDDGYLVLKGRIKELIIRGGENIMPKEVANAISLYEGVKNVVVLGVPSEYYGEEVAAAIIFKEGYHLDVDALKSFLVTKIAKYKIPSFIYEYESFPILGSGKIDAISLKKDIEKKSCKK